MPGLQALSDVVHVTAARREAHRGRGKQHLVRKRHEPVVREQTPSTIQQTPNTVSERLRVPPTQAGWTAGSDTLTSAEVAVGSNFDPLGKHTAALWLVTTAYALLQCAVSQPEYACAVSDLFTCVAGSCMLLKKEYDTDEDGDESDSNAGDSDTDEEQVLDPASEAYRRLPMAVRNQLQKLSGQVESLYDENKKLKEVSPVLSSILCRACKLPQHRH